MILNDLVQFSDVKISSNIKNVIQETLNGRDIVQNIGTQKWVIDATLPKMEENDYLPVAGMLASQLGAYGEFQIRIPIGDSNIDLSPGTASSTALSGSDVINTNTHGNVLPGTFIRFANHTKIYMVKSFSSTQISVTPRLANDVTTGTIIIYNQPTMTVRLNGDFEGFSVGTDGISLAYDLRMVEVI